VKSKKSKRDNINIALRAKQLSKIYEKSKENEVKAVDDIDVEIHQGEFTMIMGNSGSGKSTLLYMLSGLDEPSSGEVYINACRIDQLSEKKLAKFRREKIGFVFQGINLVPNLSLMENVLVSGYLSNKSRKEVETTADQLFERINLSEQKHRLPAQVSGGQQQRAAIVRALINSPSVLFADEPTGSLNHIQGKAVIDTLKDFNAKGQTVVMVTHDMKLACNGSRVIYLMDGKIKGEMRFTKFDINARETELYKWLLEMGW